MYTKTDLDNINKAILELQMGKRVVSVYHGDMKIEYESVDLEKLIELRTQILGSLAGGKQRQARFITSKGVD